MKGSFLRRSGSFGGRSKITQTLTSDYDLAQSPCLIAVTAVSKQNGKNDKSLGKWWRGTSIIAFGESVYRTTDLLGPFEKNQNVVLSNVLDSAYRDVEAGWGNEEIIRCDTHQACCRGSLG